MFVFASDFSETWITFRSEAPGSESIKVTKFGNRCCKASAGTSAFRSPAIRGVVGKTDRPEPSRLPISSIGSDGGIR